jgi:hypothetical protein
MRKLAVPRRPVDPIIDHAPAARASSLARRPERDAECETQPANKIDIPQTKAKMPDRMPRFHQEMLTGATPLEFLDPWRIPFS